MIRFILLAFAIHLSCVAPAIADDYLVRIEEIGSVEKPATDKAPQEKTFHSIEVIARPQSSFHSKVSTGPQTLTLAGKLNPTKGGKLKIDIQYRHTIDTGETVPTKNGRRKPSLNLTMLQKTLLITEGKPLTIGELKTSRSQPGETTSKLKTRFVLLVSKKPSGLPK